MVETNFDGISVSVNLDAQVAHNTNVQGALTIHEFEIKWNPQQAKQTDKPMLTLQWAFPLIDTSYQWHSLCGFNRSFSPDWAQGVSSKLSAGSPLHCFYSDGGQNRYTVALDDAVTPIYRSLGVREETGGLVCRVEIPLDATGVSDRVRREALARPGTEIAGMRTPFAGSCGLGGRRNIRPCPPCPWPRIPPIPAGIAFINRCMPIRWRPNAPGRRKWA